jgi:sugar phosphate permease
LQTNRSSSSLPIHTRFYYGWIIVAISAMSLFFSGPGQTYSISVFIEYYIEDFGWSRSLVSSLYSLATLVAGLLLFLVGRFVDKFGQRYMSAVIAILLAIACLLNSFIAGPVMLFIGFFMLRLFGQGSMTLLPGTLVPQWFIQLRGRALSFMALGGFISSFTLPLVNNWLITTWGWPVAWRVWAILLACFFAPLALYFIRNKPEDVGLLPDNDQADDDLEEEQQSEGSDRQRIEEVSWTLKEAMKVRAFWFILFCVSIPAMVNTGLVFHLVSILGESDINRSTSALVLSLMALVSFPITFIAGFVLERVKVHYVLAASFLGQIVVMIILLYTQSIQMAILFGVVRGLVGGFEAISLGIIWPNYFGREHLGSIKGLAMTTMVIGSAFGPLPFGVAYDMFGGYNEIIIFMMLFPLLGMIASFTSPAPEKKATEDQAPLHE